MINESSIAALKKQQWNTHFNRPLYENYAFSCIPDTICKLLTSQGTSPLAPDTVGGDYGPYDAVVLFFIDGFGWQFFHENQEKYSFLKRIISDGVASKISSQFPSTTAAHVTSINTGLEVGQTGIYEWFYYEPQIDRMITPLLFSYAGDHVPGALLKSTLTPQKMVPFETIYQKLAKHHVRSFVVQQESIAHSPYSQSICSGAQIIPFTHFPQALDKVVEICEQPHAEPTYIFVYFGDIDAMGHRHGINSEKFIEATHYCWKTIEEFYWKKISSSKKKIATLLTADHGMAPVDPKKTLYLNKVIPDIQESMKTNKQGMPLVPAGSCRDFFLHIKEEKLIETHHLLNEKFKGIAEVHFVDDLIKAGFFGNHPVSQRFRDRVGNLVILSFYGESVWWWEKGRFEQHFYAAHGGLTPYEMESIFLFLPSS